MLSLPEEFLLLMLKDEGGSFVSALHEELGTGIVGAALMDLGLHNRIDSDQHALWVTDPTPTGHADLDLVLSALVAGPEEQTTASSLAKVGALVPEIRELALKALVERGILSQKNGKVLWIFPQRRYPVIDGREIRDIKLRLLDVLLRDDIPDGRDVCILAVIDIVDLLGHLVPPSELGRARQRLASIARLDLIGTQLRVQLERERDMLFAAMTIQAGLH